MIHSLFEIFKQYIGIALITGLVIILILLGIAIIRLIQKIREIDKANRKLDKECLKLKGKYKNRTY